MTSPDPRKIAAAYQPWLPDGSPQPYLTREQALASLLAEPGDEADDEFTEPERDDADSGRYQEQIEAAERDPARRAGHDGPDPADPALDHARGIASAIPYRLTAKAEALLDAEPAAEAGGPEAQ